MALMEQEISKPCDLDDCQYYTYSFIQNIQPSLTGEFLYTPQHLIIFVGIMQWFGFAIQPTHSQHPLSEGQLNLAPLLKRQLVLLPLLKRQLDLALPLENSLNYYQEIFLFNPHMVNSSTYNHSPNMEAYDNSIRTKQCAVVIVTQCSIQDMTQGSKAPLVGANTASVGK